MLLTLTDKLSGKKIDVNSEQIKLLEDSENSGATHVVFSGDMGRTVIETRAQIYAALGLLPVIVSPDA